MEDNTSVICWILAIDSSLFRPSHECFFIIPQGLAEAMTKNNAIFPLRIWVVDNSGSMVKGDGHRFVETKKSDAVKVVACTRWAEIQGNKPSDV